MAGENFYVSEYDAKTHERICVHGPMTIDDMTHLVEVLRKDGFAVKVEGTANPILPEDDG